MKKILASLILILLVLSGTSCDKNRELRENLAAGAYEIGFIEGFIFTLDAAAHFLTGTLKSADIDVETEAKRTWENSGVVYVESKTDSLGVVMDSTLTNTLFVVYSLGFTAGIGEGERYIREYILGDKPEEEFDEQARAAELFEKNRMELVSYLEGLEIIRKPATGKEG